MMVQFTDYHNHSTFSPDARSSLLNMAETAVAKGIQQLGFAEHAEWVPDWTRRFGPNRFEGYLDAIANLRTQMAHTDLVIFSGVELGNPHDFPREVEALLADCPFELRVGSLHWLNGENIHDASCFRGRDAHQVYADYFVELAHMATACELDIIAHFDRICWRGGLLGHPLEPHKIEATIRKTLETIARQRLVLEINTARLHHTPHWHPTLITLLTWFREAGGYRLTISSDAHDVYQLGRNRETAVDLLAQAGFSEENLVLFDVAAAR